MEKKDTKKIILLVAIFVVLAALAIIIYNVAKPSGTAGTKKIVFEVKDADGKVKTFKIKTNEEFLGPVLREKKLIDGSDSDWGFYVTTVNGITADASKTEWWYLTVDGEMSLYGVDQLPVEDGKTYGFEFKVGW